MKNPVEVIHESGRVTTVPRNQLRALRKHGWRLVSEVDAATTPEPPIVTTFQEAHREALHSDDPEPVSYRPFRSPFDS